jgi:signal transduction histidine kinase
VTVSEPKARRHALRQRWRHARHSLRARLIGLFLLLALLMTLTFLAGTQAALRFGWQGYVQPLIANYIDTLTAEIGTPPNVERAQALAQRLPLRIRIEGPVVNWSSQPGFAAGRWHDAHRAGRVDASNPWRPQRVLADGHRITFGLATVARDDSPEDTPRLIGWATLAALLVLTALAYAAVHMLLRPLVHIRTGVVRYSAGDFSQPIATRRHDELGDLAGQINHMAEALHGMLDAKRALLLAISHELRSPLTRARLNAELVDDSAPRTALLHDLAEMRDLITDLLESERLATGHATLQCEPTDLNELVRGLLAASFADDAIDADLAPQVPTLMLDRTRMRMLVRNLLDNALRHGSVGGAGTGSADGTGPIAPPRINTHSDADALYLVVRDHGPGVPDAVLPQLAEAFYRPDAARQRTTGGVGLGLHLCRLVAQAHGGRLLLRNAQPGLEVTVRLPLPR